MSLKRKSNVLALFPNAKRSRQMGFITPRPRPKRAAVGFEGVRFGKATSGTMAPEIKNFDNNVAATSVVAGTPYIASMTAGIAEGTTLGNRVGGKIFIKSFDLEGNITVTLNGAGIGSPSAFIDVFCVWDKQPDGALPAIGAIFTSTNTNLTFGNVGQTERFVILRRERIVLDEAQRMGANFVWHVPLALATKFPDATQVPNTNDIYVCALSPNTVAAGSYTPNLAFTGRVKFTDA